MLSLQVRSLEQGAHQCPHPQFRLKASLAMCYSVDERGCGCILRGVFIEDFSCES